MLLTLTDMQRQQEAIEDVLSVVRYRITTLPVGDPWRDYFVALAVDLDGGTEDDPDQCPRLELVKPDASDR